MEDATPVYALISMAKDFRRILQYDDHEPEMGKVYIPLYPIQLTVIN